MKIGDLVTRRVDRAGHELLPAWPGGIVTVTEASGTHVKVYWPEHGALWCPVKWVEVISENR